MKRHETRPDWREWRRRRAWALKQQGWKQKDIAVALGVTKGAVSQWVTRARTGGVAALRRRPVPGRPPKLIPAQVRHLPEPLAAGAEAYGFRGEVWTTKRVAHLIGLRLGVRYHPAHVSRLLRAVGWSVQQPIQRATQRNEAAIKAWREERWPALKKKRRRTNAPASGSISRGRARREQQCRQAERANNEAFPSLVHGPFTFLFKNNGHALGQARRARPSTVRVFTVSGFALNNPDGVDAGTSIREEGETHHSIRLSPAYHR